MANAPIALVSQKGRGRSSIKTGVSKTVKAGRGSGASPLPAAAQSMARGNGRVYRAQGGNARKYQMGVGTPARTSSAPARLPGHKTLGGQPAVGGTRTPAGARVGGSLGY
jgi:hypothetical protein